MPDDYTLQDYSREKDLPADFLSRLGLNTLTVNNRTYISIPYYNEYGRRSATQYRSGSNFWWGDGSTIVPYGVDRLRGAPDDKAILLVEGASDAQTAWYHNIFALGIPGAQMWKHSWYRYIKGRTIYLWKEPDEGGEAFRDKISKTTGFHCIEAPTEYKDLNELHQSVGSDTRRIVHDLIRNNSHIVRKNKDYARKSFERNIQWNLSDAEEKVRKARRMSILDVVSRLGIDKGLTKKSDQYAIICPFHDDHDPSLYLDDQKGLWICFACGDKSGDQIDLWKEVRGLDFKDTLDEMVG